MLHNSWLESSCSEEGGRIILHEYRGTNPVSDIAFLMGYLWCRAEEFRGAFFGSPVIILHACEGECPGLSIHNPALLAGRVYYPDIILGHNFPEKAQSYEQGSFFHILYTQLIALLSPHQLLGISMDGGGEGKQLYPLAHALKDYALSLDNVYLEDRQAAQDQAAPNVGRDISRGKTQWL